MNRSGPRKFALGIYLTLLCAMFVFTLVAGRPNQGLLSMSAAGRLLFCMSAAVGIVLAPHLLKPFGSLGERPSQKVLRVSIGFVILSVAWALACFGCVHRMALLLDGPVSTESARLERPLFPGPPTWCGHYTTLHTESGYTGSLCMERLLGRSELIPLLGCVPLDAPATVQVTRTFLGPVGSLLEVVDVDGRCAKRGSKR